MKKDVYLDFCLYMDTVRVAWRKKQKPPDVRAQLLSDVEKLLHSLIEEQGRKLVLEGIEDENEKR